MFIVSKLQSWVPSSVTRVLETVMGTLGSSMFVRVAERLSQVD